MGQSYAILVGIDRIPTFGVWPHASTEVTHFSDVLSKIKIAKSEQTLLVNSAATKSAIESRFRKLLKTITTDDELWFIWAGSSFLENDDLYLATVDTLDDDREATAIRFADWLASFSRSGVTVRCVFDLPFLPTSGDFEDSHNVVAFFSHQVDEESQHANQRRLWLYMISEIISGKIEAITDSQITSADFQRVVIDEFPRLLRKHVSEAAPQSPGILGNVTIPVPIATSTSSKSKAKLSLKQLKKLVFRGERPAKIRELTNYQKNFRLPDANTPSAQKWLNRLASPDIQADLDDKFNAIREELGYKRKDLECELSPDGFGFIRTPAFDYAVSVSLDSADPTSLIWRREVSQFSKGDLLQKPAFRQVFQDSLDTLEFHFDQLIDIEELVDRIEDQRPEGVKIRVGSDASFCEVTILGFIGLVRVERSLLRIVAPTGLGPASLIEQFFAFQAQFGGRKGLPAIK